MGRTKKGRYEDYRGTKRWEVKHPRYGRCYVLSPDPDSAMVAAAQIWGVKWTSLEFYTVCTICRA